MGFTCSVIRTLLSVLNYQYYWRYPILTFKSRQSLKAHIDDELFSILHPLAHWRKAASFSPIYRYFYDKYSIEIHCLVVPVQEFTAKTSHTMYTIANPPTSFRILKNKMEVLFFPSLATLKKNTERMFFRTL